MQTINSLNLIIYYAYLRLIQRYCLPSASVSSEVGFPFPEIGPVTDVSVQ